MGKYAVRDWEEVEAKVFKKLWESSLTREHLESYYKDMDKLFFQDEHLKRIKKSRAQKIHIIFTLLKKKDFFTNRQSQVLNLLFGWNGKIFVGHRGFSDIAKIINIKQPVVYNHFKAAIKKIRKHFNQKRED